ncbi:acetyl-CoA carboxylase biotin carboxylase subunit family protein [Xenorhabdus sp. SGI246]|uniref:ATP-grasp domain-containing protein n=1 Tax=Xenorhabdus sp. SGI246 TaxID=3158263 RepID=UPI00349FBF3C
MSLEIHINNQASFHRGKPTIFCMPDIKDSERFVQLCYQYNLNLILLIKKKWLDSTDCSLALAYLVVDDPLANHACKKIITALKQVKGTLSIITAPIHINYFIAFSELHVELMASIATHINQDTHVIDVAQSFRDKWIMRKTANEHGLFCPKFTLASEMLISPEHFERFTESVENSAKHKGNQVGFIIKPRSFWGSMGVTEHSDRTSLFYTLQELDTPEEYLVEEKIQGRLLHVDAAVFQHKIIYQSIGAYACSLLPSDQTKPSHFMWHTMLPDSPNSHRLFEFNRRVLQAFNLEYGFTHTEIFIEENTGNLILCETASRPPGLRLFELHAKAYGKHAFDVFINALISPASACKEPSFSIKNDELNCIGMIIFNPPIGEVKSITPIEEIIDEHVIEWEQNAKIGSYFSSTHYTEKMGYVICSAKNEHECVKYLNNYNNKFNYTTIKQD